MASPFVGGWNRIKRAARFLRAHPRWAIEFVEQDRQPVLKMSADSDWAGNPLTRKSVSCCHAMLGRHLIKSYVGSHSAPALSSGEAEFVAQVKSGSIALGIQSLAKDLGEEVSLELGADSSAAKGVLGRLGLGKIRHLETGSLWILHFVDRGVFKLGKACGSRENSADVGTKDLNEGDMRRCLELVRVVELSGSHSLALQIE